jgi:hypothetical protein
MESHKRVLGILFIALGTFQILLMLLLSTFMTSLFGFIMSQAEPEGARVIEIVAEFIRYIPLLIIVFLALPALVAGIGLVAEKPWALILALVIGCLNIFSFPFGTAIGIYTIWVYAENNKITRASSSQA